MLEVLEKITWHLDEPFADPSAVPTWYVCKMARENVTVALSGDGGDESFGGYTFRYIPHIVESKIRSRLPLMLRNAVFGALGKFYPAHHRLPKPFRLKTIFENIAVDDAQAFYKDLTWLRQEERDRIYNAAFMNSLKGFNPFELVYPLYYGCDSTNPLYRSQFTDIQFYMTEDVLVKVDRMSMAHSLEVRCPLLDYRLIEFAATLPEHLKLNKRYGKLVLQKAANKRLPPEIICRHKRGFSIPTAHWLRNDLKTTAYDIIFRKPSIIADHLIPGEIQRIWNEHQSESRDNSMFLWSLMMLGLWEKKHL
jgi:asparagine synthase (glutamine-hydrolysing)